MIERSEAVMLLEEALHRIQSPTTNANGMSEETGGAYWRLAKVLRLYLDPRLEEQEGPKHAARLRKLHGRIERQQNKSYATR